MSYFDAEPPFDMQGMLPCEYWDKSQNGRHLWWMLQHKRCGVTKRLSEMLVWYCQSRLFARFSGLLAVDFATKATDDDRIAADSATDAIGFVEGNPTRELALLADWFRENVPNPFKE